MATATTPDDDDLEARINSFLLRYRRVLMRKGVLLEPPRELLERLDPKGRDDLARSMEAFRTGEAIAPTAEAPAPLGASGLSRRRFRFGRRIGRGGMGVVFEADDLWLGRTVAVKVLRRKLVGRPGEADRFRREARIAGALEHPSIPPIHDFGGFRGGRPCIAMQLIKGQTLHKWLATRRSATSEFLSDSLTVFEQVCRAVGHAHSRGVIHRDLKTDNIKVGESGEVWVLDWGLAKELGSADAIADGSGPETSPVGPKAGLTTAGSVVGTPHSMSPEQADPMRGPVEKPSNVFALGSILCEILTGTPAYIGPGDRRRGAQPRPSRRPRRDPPAAPLLEAQRRADRPRRPLPGRGRLRSPCRRLRGGRGDRRASPIARIEGEEGPRGPAMAADQPRRHVRPADGIPRGHGPVATGRDRREERGGDERRPLRFRRRPEAQRPGLHQSPGRAARRRDPPPQGLSAPDRRPPGRQAAEPGVRPDGQRLSRSGRIRAGVRLLSTAEGYFDALVQSGGKSPDPEAVFGLAVTRGSRGVILGQTRTRTEEAATLFRSAGEGFSSLKTAGWGDPSDLRRRLSLCLNGEGNCLRFSDPEASVEAYRKVLAAFRDLVKADPNDAKSKLWEIKSASNLAIELEIAGRFAEARTIHDEADRSSKEAVARIEFALARKADPGRDPWLLQEKPIREARGIALANLGSLLSRTADPARAERVIGEALATYEDLLRSAPESLEFAWGVAMTRSDLGHHLDRAAPPAATGPPTC